jgi:hypothetical protein
MIYVAALLLAVFAGSIPTLANSPWDPREMEPRVDPLIEGEDQNNSGNPAPESDPIETQ